MNNGGPAAFPRITVYTEGKVGTVESPGMTLRDYFAAKAMASLIICAGKNIMGDTVVRDSYIFADGMLKERDK